MISLAGLPKEYQAQTLTLPADATDFEYPVRFQFGAKAGGLPNIRVVATAQVDPENANRKVRSNGVPLSIKVSPGEKPAE